MGNFQFSSLRHNTSSRTLEISETGISHCRHQRSGRKEGRRPVFSSLSSLLPLSPPSDFWRQTSPFSVGLVEDLFGKKRGGRVGWCHLLHPWDEEEGRRRKKKESLKYLAPSKKKSFFFFSSFLQTFIFLKRRWRRRRGGSKNQGHFFSITVPIKQWFPICAHYQTWCGVGCLMLQKSQSGSLDAGMKVTKWVTGCSGDP